MNEAVTKRFLLYFRLMLLVWILIANAIIHVTGLEYSWLIFLSNIMMFTLEGDVKDRFVTVELGGLVGLILTVIALLSITALNPVLGGFFGFLIPLAVVLFILIILHPYAPKVLNNVGFAYLTVCLICWFWVPRKPRQATSRCVTARARPPRWSWMRSSQR